MNSRPSSVIWVKQVLNALIIICVPVGLFFAFAMANNEISYKYEVEGPDYQEKLASGNWTKNDHRIMDNIAFHRAAARATFYAFITLILARIGQSVVKSHSIQRMQGPAKPSTRISRMMGDKSKMKAMIADRRRRG